MNEFKKAMNNLIRVVHGSHFQAIFSSLGWGPLLCMACMSSIFLVIYWIHFLLISVQSSVKNIQQNKMQEKLKAIQVTSTNCLPSPPLQAPHKFQISNTCVWKHHLLFGWDSREYQNLDCDNQGGFIAATHLKINKITHLYFTRRCQRVDTPVNKSKSLNSPWIAVWILVSVLKLMLFVASSKTMI